MGNYKDRDGGFQIKDTDTERLLPTSYQGPLPLHQSVMCSDSSLDTISTHRRANCARSHILVVLVRVVICQYTSNLRICKYANKILTREVARVHVLDTGIDSGGDGGHAVFVASARHSAGRQRCHSRRGSEQKNSDLGEHCSR